MPLNLGAPEILILLVIILLVFGVGRLPEIGRAIGNGLREFRESVSTANELMKDEDKRESPGKEGDK